MFNKNKNEKSKKRFKKEDDCELVDPAIIEELYPSYPMGRASIPMTEKELKERKKEAKKELRAERTLNSLLAFAVTAGFTIGVWCVGSLINWGVVAAAEKKLRKEMIGYKAEVVETIEDKVSELSDFDLASVELLKGEDKYFCKVFGKTGLKDIMGLKENNYVNILFDIPEVDANNILNAIENAENTKRMGAYNSPEHVMQLDNVSYICWAEKNRLKKTGETFKKLYGAIDSAVKNAYGYEVEKVAEASSFNNSISSAYRYTKPETLSEVIYKHFNITYNITDFINSGLLTTGISKVVRDEEKNESYFFVDSLQVVNNAKQGATSDKLKIDSCRAMVVVEGANLSQEEVYAKFLSGQHKNFVELVRERLGSKVGVLNGKIQEDVEEIELT